LTPPGVRQLCIRLARQLGIGQANPHKFRRTFTLEMLRSDCDTFRLAQLLGHSMRLAGIISSAWEEVEKGANGAGRQLRSVCKQYK
jgi:integrase